MRIIIDALMDAVMEYFHITEQQLEEFTASFIQKTAKVHAKGIGVRFSGCLSAIL